MGTVITHVGDLSYLVFSSWGVTPSRGSLHLERERRRNIKTPDTDYFIVNAHRVLGNPYIYPSHLITGG